MKRLHKILRIVWLSAGALFFLWLLYSVQAHGVDPAVMRGDEAMDVAETADAIHFTPQDARTTGLLFYPGALVEPEAYAPLARAIAEQGFPTIIVKLPMRTASFGSQEDDVIAFGETLIAENDAVQEWFVAGHSRGAAIAGRFAQRSADLIDGLILIGTSHPKEAEFSLADAPITVTKIYATNDGLASVAEVQTNAHLLPADTRWVEIEGGNHAQFGYYGAQLGDSRADIGRERQQALTLAAILEALAGR